MNPPRPETEPIPPQTEPIPPQTEPITLEQLQALAHRAGLDLTPAELERLLPMYQTLAGQLALLHDPALPLDWPAAPFRPDAPE